MISGTTKLYSLARGAVAVLVLLSVVSGAVAGPDYQSIMKAIASEGRNSVRFDEKIVAYYLEEPLVSSGSMYFEPPDKLTKIIEQPEYIRQVIQADSVVITRGDRSRSFPLSNHTALELMANTLRSLLSGNTADIEQEFAVKVVHEGEAWTMEMVPKNDVVLETIESVVIEGKAGVIHRYTVTESNGDYSVTSLHDENGN